MIKKLFIACWAALALSAQAVPVVFFDASLETTAIALTDGVPGFDTQTSPPLDLPVSASADSLGTTDLATAGAIGAAGLLSTTADVTGGGGIASAVASSRFTGSFTNAGPLLLSIDFTALDFATGSGIASTTLFVSLTSNGVTLFEDYVTGPLELQYDLVAGTTGVLDLTLASEVSAGFPLAEFGNAAGFGLASFAVSAVPLPATWLMLMFGLGPVIAVVRRRRPVQV